MRVFIRIIAVLTVLAVAAGCVPTTTGTAPNTVPHLIIYTAHKKEVYAPVVKEFQERTGIWVRVEEAGTNELLARISGEPAACDVMFGGGVESLEAYSDCFLPYQTAESAYIDPALCSDKNIWTPFSALPLVFIYNTKLLNDETAPHTWDDLLQPQWTGKVAYADPNISGSCYTALATAIQALPEREHSETVEAFYNIIGGALLDSSTEVYTNVSNGSFMVGITLEESALKQIKQGKDVAWASGRKRAILEQWNSLSSARKVKGELQ